jgi:hypothetical protein
VMMIGSRFPLVDLTFVFFSLNIRIVLLVRDPRGTMYSRNVYRWCRQSPDCSQVANLCQDMVEDYKTALELRKEFPDRLK